MEDVDEEDLEHEVRDVRQHDDLQRTAQVRDAAQVALAGESDQRGGQPERGDPEVRECVVARLAVCAEPEEKRLTDDLQDDEQRDSDPERSPERLGREPRGLLVPTRARGARDDGGRAVGEEVEDREGAGEHRPGETECGDLRPAQVADDCRVGEHVQRLGRERAEGRQRQADDLAVVRGTETHRDRRR